MYAPDLSVFSKLKTKRDFDIEAENRDFQRVLRDAEIRKAQMVDVEGMGEQAFFKAAQGLQLTPAEEAAARFVDAKSGGISFNPVTGELIQKPRISDKIGLGGMPAQQMGGMNLPPSAMGDLPDMQLPPVGTFATADDIAKMGNVDDYVPPVSMGALSDGTMPPAPMQTPQSKSPFEQKYQDALASARGNPKLEQQIKADYLKSTLEPNESQAKAAAFADRIRASNAIINDPEISKAGTDITEKSKSGVPIIGNFLTSENYKLYDQAKRDIINAILRRESGAVIADSEFLNADLQYFPQPGDTPEVIQQKALNRANALAGIEYSAGASYKPTDIVVPKAQPKQQPQPPKKGSLVDGYMFNGGDPSNPKNWKKVK